jgi:hypothetical protein
MGRVSADQALRSYKWSYIRLAALDLRWQNLWSFWAIAVVLTLLGRTISPLFTDQCQPVADRRWAYLLVFAGQSSQSASPMAKVPLWRGGIG